MNKNVKKGIALFFQEILGKKTPVIWMDSDGPRPKGRYLTLKISPMAGNENDEYKNLQDGSIKQTTRLSYNLSLQTYRKGAIDTALDLRSNLRKLSYADKFFIDLRGENHCLNIGLVGDVVDLTTLVETNHEERASLEVKLNYSESIIDKGVKDCGLGAKFPVIIKGKYKKADDEIAVENITTITK